MKVIKKVDPVVDFNMNVCCMHCGSELQICAADMQHTPAEGGNQRDYCDERFYVTCAVCQENIGVDSSKIPYLVAKRTRAKSTSRGSHLDR